MLLKTWVSRFQRGNPGFPKGRGTLLSKIQDNTDRPITLVIQWPRFGPYHLARLNAAFQGLKRDGVRVVGMETASLDDTYAWQQETGGTVFERCVVLPGKVYEKSSPVDMWFGVYSVLERVKPHAVAICGWSSHDAWSALAWCKLHRRRAILMCASKYDDAPRVASKEWLKGVVVRQFDAAVCSGSPQRSYLERLGMRPEQILYGAGVIDNEFFWQGAEHARRDPTAHRSLTGLESPGPFFLASARFMKWKNLDGLLRAYAEYRRRLDNSDRGRAAWRLVIVGDGPERSALERLVHSERIQGVSFPGFVQIDKLPVYYGLASVFIHPSHKEPWGLVVNEAMAAGLPVLVSNCCGCAQDLVCEGGNGFTFPSDDAGYLSNLMMRVSSGEVDLESMSMASRNQIQEWGPKRFADGMYGALQSSLRSKR